MRLYEVRLAGAVNRYVEAETRQDAIDMVRRSLLDALRLEASEADPLIGQMWRAADKRQRTRLLLRLDGLTRPVTRSAVETTRVRLEQQLAHEERTLDWIASARDAAPPVSAEGARTLATIFDASHRRWLLQQLQ